MSLQIANWATNIGKDELLQYLFYSNLVLVPIVENSQKQKNLD